ncbi:rhodanese-like domain-containing protein [Siphonobacter aquaeclarae]|uniref:Rhodanese-related sulfurtransferase n=1 Tax=Siphonobacter aquaeclarae TaxID=563176 RepID=A0A1G9YF38_9BACT|nr:rhodanese-like domain-containing protein [Siphonobacter aquaeclarae]SDN07061.1 Rhodanese-related sulfurtransferase [Siphonobacter aquaeclarae]
MKNFLKTLFGNPWEETRKLLEAGAVVIDVRTPGEFGSGHYPGAINIPLDRLEEKAETVRNYKKAVIVCCASGMRSARAKSVLTRLGVPDVHNAGGWHNL